MAGMKRWAKIAVIPAVVAGLLLFWPLPYFSEGPGPTEDVATMIKISDHERYSSDGRFLLTTVNQSSHRLSPAELFLVWLDPNANAVPDEVIVPPGTSLEEEAELAAEQMRQSQVSATVVALEAAAGYPDEHGTGALVAGVVQDCPAFGPLEAGDIVTAIEGAELADAQAASDAIDAVPEAEPVRFTVETAKGSRQVAVKRAKCIPKEGPILGVSMVNTFPFPVAINDKGIGGPSAGLMISLGLYDALTPGDLTDGRTIAGTGVIEFDGDVAPIGGVTKKVIAARAADADLFLVPEENLAEAKTEAKGLRLVPVSSFDEAVRALGGDTVTTSPSASPAAPVSPAPSPSAG